MAILVRIIGIILVLTAVIYFVKPAIMRRLLGFFKYGNRIYIAGVIRLALAIIFLLAARECDLTWIIVIFGILFLLGGLLIFTLGNKRITPILEWYEKQTDLLLRILVLIVLAIGALIIYAA